MKTLALYIEKWYIIGAVCTDGVPRPMSLPNQEDRIWLYFFEDEFNDNVVYGKANQCHFMNKENHYYGDVFSKIIDPRVFFSRYGRKESLRRIFEVSGLFSDIKAVLEKDTEIETYVSFSIDIPIEAQLEFLIILKEQGFVVKESVARIDHLCLEKARQNGSISEEGHYIVLNACNENLHYSLYRLTEKVFVREGEECLLGMGSDLRGRALLEAVVNKVNKRQRFLQNNNEIEAEYLRLGQFMDPWINRLNRAGNIKPFVIPNVTFSNAPFVETSVSLMKKEVDERTNVIVNDIMRAIADFVYVMNVPYEEIKGILFLGNTFSNSQFEKSISSHFVFSDNSIIRVKEAELASAVSIYERMDCGQFSAASKDFLTNAETERKRVENAIKEEEIRIKANAQRQRVEQEEKEAHEAENKYKEAMARVEEYEKKGDYAQMRDWCEIALQHYPDDAHAKEKIEFASQKIAEEKVKSDQYNTIIKQALKSLKEGKFQDALSQSDSALNVRPNSKEAHRIHDEASRAIEKLQKVKEFLTRADLFIAQRSYVEAASEVEKALALDDSNKTAKDRLREIKQKQSEMDSVLDDLKAQLKVAHVSHDYGKAVVICEKLIEVDPTNLRKWSETLQQFRNLEEEKAKIMTHLKSLADDIESAVWEENWEKVSVLCKQYLEVENDEKIRLRLEQAERKQKVLIVQKQFDDAISEENWKNAIELGNKYPVLKENSNNNKLLAYARQQVRLSKMQKTKTVPNNQVDALLTDNNIEHVNDSERDKKTYRRNKTYFKQSEQKTTLLPEPTVEINIEISKKRFPIPKHKSKESVGSNRDSNLIEKQKDAEDIEHQNKRKYPKLNHKHNKKE